MKLKSSGINSEQSLQELKDNAVEINYSQSSKDVDKPRVIFVLGGPGAGKGTQCEKLSYDLGMTHLSAGELLRAERQSGSSNGQLIESYIKDGKIVPVKITLDCLRKAMEMTSSHRFLIDGFPRNFDNVQGWMTHMTSVCDIESVIFLDCPQEELEKRLLHRGKTSGRTDDNIDSARKRFSTFHSETMPVVLHYEKEGLLVRVSGKQTREEVYAELRRNIEPFIVQDLLARTQELLDAISSNDWSVYEHLCASDISCFEKEAQGHLATGLQFHKFYFTTQPSSLRTQSTISQPHVRIMGTSAVVSYSRLLQIEQTDGKKETKVFDETRVWQLIRGKWRNVHFHRHPVVDKA